MEEAPSLHEYKRTPVFDEHTVPAALRRDHRTRDGVWGRIVVEAGSLRVTDAGGEQVVHAGEAAVMAPGQTHAVEPLGAVRFYVAFCREEPRATRT